MIINKTQLDEMEHLYRVALVNSLSGFKSANLLATVHPSGSTNLCIVSSCFHLGANPPLLGLIIRPHSVDRHSLENILATGHYTLNHVHAEIVPKAHQTSARYPRDTSEFAATGLTEEWQEGCPVPFVKEAQIRMALTLKEHHHLEINGTELIIGEIEQIQIPDACLAEDGFVDIEQAGTVALSGLDRYHLTSHLTRLSYAKPDRELREIPMSPSAPDA